MTDDRGGHGFVHDWPASRVRFGAGERASVAAEADRLGAQHVLLIADAAVGDEIGDALGGRVAARTARVVQHVSPVAARRAAALAPGADAIVCVGGGSATGLAKAIALTTGLPILAVPTTYAGSEMTSIWGLTDHGRKTTGRDERVRPGTVVYDPELTMSLPVDMSVASGLNAVAHCVEAQYSPAASPLTDVVAREGMAAVLAALPVLSAAPADPEARAAALRGAWFGGWALQVASMGLHHKICHVLGGRFGLPHAPLHAALLSHVVAVAPPDAVAVLAGLLHVAPENAGPALWDLTASLGAATALRDIGLGASDLPAAQTAVADALARAKQLPPRPLDADQAARLVAAAWHGDRPPAA